MGEAVDPQEPEEIAETSKESIEKVRFMVEELKIVEEHEKGILGE
jgi:hypothetical protein